MHLHMDNNYQYLINDRLDSIYYLSITYISLMN